MDEPIDPYGAGWYPPTNPYSAAGPAPYAPAQNAPYGYPPGPPAYGYASGQPAPYGPVQPQLAYGYPLPAQPPSAGLGGHRRRAAIGISAVVLAAAIIVTVLVAGGTTNKPGPPIVVPASIGAFQQITDATADRVKQAMQSEAQSFGLAQAFLDHTSLGVYGSGGSDQPNLILVVGRTDAVPGLQSNNASDSVDALLSGAVDQPTAYPPGDHAGSLKCGPAALAAALETACGWYDSSTIGLLLSIDPAQDPAALAVLANVVRDDIK